MPLAAIYRWLMLAHILAAMVWVGGLAALVAMGTYLRRTGEVEAVARFVASLRVVGPMVLTPAAVLVLASGAWMVVVGAAFLSRAALAAERAVTGGDHDQARRQLQRWSWGIGLILLLLAVATWDMVFKPGA
jgi:uncharacterized membrane protein